MTENVKVIVKFKNVGVEAKEEFISTLGAEIVHVYNSINSITIQLPRDRLKTLKADPDVDWVEETTPEDVTILGFPSEEVPEIAEASQNIPWGILKIRAIDVHLKGNKGSGINVCILDTGIDYNHEDLVGQMKVGRNFIIGGNNPFDDQGHGTHVAGTIAALDNGLGVIGVAPEVNLMIGKVLDKNGNGSYDNIVAGIQWAIDIGADIISMSFGGGGYSQALKEMCDAANRDGIVLIAAAGNAGGDGSVDTIGYPAKFDSVIAVAATDINDKRASFSSTGLEMWVSAPGVNVISTVPKGTCQLCNPTGYRSLNGTSMSTPHVSGTVALILKSNPSLKPIAIRNVLRTTSLDLGTPGFDVFYGYGRIDALSATDGSPVPTPPPTPPPTLPPTPPPTPQPKNRYNVNQVGNFGVIATKTPIGGVDSDTACMIMCKMIKDIDSK